MTKATKILLFVASLMLAGCITTFKEESPQYTIYSRCHDPIYVQISTARGHKGARSQITAETLNDVQTPEGLKKSPSGPEQFNGGIFAKFLHEITRCQVLPVEKDNPPESYLDIEIVTDASKESFSFWNIMTIATLYIVPSKVEELIEVRVNLIKDGKSVSHQEMSRGRFVWFGMVLLPAMPFYPSYSVGHELVLLQLASDTAAYLYAQEPKRLRQDIK